MKLFLLNRRKIWKGIEIMDNPQGIEFHDTKSNRLMKLVLEQGPWYYWIVYLHVEGHWVSLRKATEEDIRDILQSVFAAQTEHRLTEADQQRCLVSELDSVLRRYAEEFDLTNVSAIGALEIVKLNWFNKIWEEENDDDDESEEFAN